MHITDESRLREIVGHPMEIIRDKARALITIHESGLKPGGRAYGPADFGLPEISAAYEILHGESLHLDALIEGLRRLRADAPEAPAG